MEGAGRHLEDARRQQTDLVPREIHRRKQEISFRFIESVFPFLNICSTGPGLSADGSERKNQKMKGTKKKKLHSFGGNIFL